VIEQCGNQEQFQGGADAMQARRPRRIRPKHADDGERDEHKGQGAGGMRQMARISSPVEGRNHHQQEQRDEDCGRRGRPWQRSCSHDREHIGCLIKYGRIEPSLSLAPRDQLRWFVLDARVSGHHVTSHCAAIRKSGAASRARRSRAWVWWPNRSASSSRRSRIRRRHSSWRAATRTTEAQIDSVENGSK
jgi:hypothetical protein